MTATTTLHDLGISRDFPILRTHVNGKRLVYLDSAATSQKPSAVLKRIVDFYETSNANVHRGVHALSEQATDAYESSRKTVAGFIGAQDHREIIFVRNTTEGINLLAQGMAHTLQPGDTILLTQMEHHSDIVPWQMVAQRTGATVKFIPITAEGSLDMDAARSLIEEMPKLLAITHVSNALGTINPVAELAELAHAHGALVIVDAAQSVPHMPVDVAELGVDALVFSGHKMLGPLGIGVVWARMGLLQSLAPMLGGGDMIKEVTAEGFSLNDIPHRFEAGTPNVAGAVGLAAAIHYLGAIGMIRVAEHEAALTAYALKKLASIPQVKIYGPREPSARIGVISFNVGDMHAHDVGSVLDGQGVAVRAGHHCAQPLLDALGIPASCRVSFYIYNTPEDVDALVAAIHHAIEVFRL